MGEYPRDQYYFRYRKGKFMNLFDIKNDLATDRKKAVIIDSDTYNEEDDQFAVAYAMFSTRKVNLLALNAAPFHNWHSESFEDGMLKSYDELQHITKLVDPNHNIPIFKGSRERMKDINTPVPSEAADNIIKIARSIDEPLYIIGIGAITNVASAIVKAPDIKDKICVIWLGLNAPDYPGDQGEFNYCQDPIAGQALFASGANILLMPAFGGSSALRVSPYELEHVLGGKSELADYLINLVKERALPNISYTKVIWDLAGIAVITMNDAMHFYFMNVPEFQNNTPIFTSSNTRPVMLVAKYLDRDYIYLDVYEKFLGLHG